MGKKEKQIYFCVDIQIKYHILSYYFILCIFIEFIHHLHIHVHIYIHLNGFDVDVDHHFHFQYQSIVMQSCDYMAHVHGLSERHGTTDPFAAFDMPSNISSKRLEYPSCLTVLFKRTSSTRIVLIIINFGADGENTICMYIYVYIYIYIYRLNIILYIIIFYIMYIH